MPYLVTCPPGESVSILKALSERKLDDGTVIGYDHASIIRFRADVLDDEDVSPVVVKLLDGDPDGPDAKSVRHTQSMLRKITPAQAKKYRSGSAPINVNDDMVVTEPEFDPVAAQVTAKPAGSFGKE